MRPVELFLNSVSDPAVRQALSDIMTASHQNKQIPVQAWTIRGNPTGQSTSPTDFTIDGLTAKVTPASGDELIIWDVAGNAIKKTTFGGFAGALGNAMATTLVVGDGTDVDHSGGSQILVSRNFDPGAGNSHSYSDSSIINWSHSGFGSCAYDDETIIQGSAANPLHHASIQAFPQFSGSGTMGALLGFNWAPVINSGTITLVECLSLQGITMNGGSVGTVYGMLIGGLRSTGTLAGDRGILTAAGITNELRGNTILSGGISMATVSLTLANGLNSNIAMPGSMRANVVGPTGAFSVGGFVAGADGQRLHIYNTTAETMTIVNEDASSTAGNRIKTLTGGNVVLRTSATSYATLVYDDLTSLRWILESTN